MSANSSNRTITRAACRRIEFACCAFGLLALVSACVGGPKCENETIRELPSSAGDRRAVVFHRGCGANHGYATHISLVAATRALPDSVGNTFIANTNQGNAPAGPHGGPAVAVRWITPDTLEVRYHPAARVFTREAHVSGVEIRYMIDAGAARASPARSGR